MRRAQKSGVGDEDYFNRALIDYQAKTGNTVSGRDKVRDDAKKKGRTLRASGSLSMNNEALARLMVTEITTPEKEQSDVFLEIKRREVECRE
ncbi:hypothetical protein Tco_0883373 [Tanacetum coccineum]